MKYFKDYLTFRDLIIISPIFLLTLKHWISAILLLSFLGSIIFLFTRNFNIFKKLTDDPWRFILFLSLIGPVLAVAISQFLRFELFLPNFDAPLRIALCAPIFLAISLGWLSKNGDYFITCIWGKYVLPLTIIWTFLFRPSWSNNWGTRITTYFVDPLSFGSLTLLLTFMVFYTINIYFTKLNWFFKLISIISIPLGLYLSVLSGSRTGWAAVPIIFVIWLKIFGVPKYGFLKSTLITITSMIVAITIISTNPFLTTKLLQALNALSNYNWNNMNAGSDDVRISLYRMAYFYFMSNPLLGWGDLGWIKIMNSPEIMIFSTEETRYIATHGFHNEILTNSVRSGVWGLVSSLSFFIIPLICGFKLIKNNDKYIGGFLIFFIIFNLIAGLTTEVTNLIFLSSFLGLVIAVTAGEGFYKLDDSKKSGIPPIQ